MTAAALRRWRERIGLTQAELAEAMGLSEHGLYYLERERGGRAIQRHHQRHLQALAKAWGCPAPPVDAALGPLPTRHQLRGSRAR